MDSKEATLIVVSVNSNPFKDKVYLLLYVDDMLLADNSTDEIIKGKAILKKKFDIKNL